MNNSADDIAASSDSRRRGEQDIGEYIREEPLTALAIAGGAGFILGGGAKSRIGLALLTIVGRMALRDIASSFVLDLITGEPDNRINGRVKERSGSHGNRRDDD